MHHDQGTSHHDSITLLGPRSSDRTPGWASDSGLTPEPTEQATSNRDDSAADGVQGDHAGQHERQHHQRCAALPGAMGLCVHNAGNGEEKCNGEEDSAGLGEPKPVPEPSPIPSDARHA